MFEPRRVLIVNPFGIGDMLFSMPLVGALKASFPSVSISYIGNARTAPILGNDPRLDKVFSYERDEFVAVYKRSPLAFVNKWLNLVRDLRAGGFDTAYDLSLGSPLALALALAGIPRRIGYDFKGRGRWLTHKVPLPGYEGRHAAEYYLALLDQDHRGKMAIFPSPADQAWAREFMLRYKLSAKEFIVIHPGGGASWGKGAGLKRWPAVNFAKLADKMIEKRACPIILVGDKNEVALCTEVAQAMRQRVVVAAGEMNVLQAAALMQAARLVVANDGGPLHVAVAAGAVTASIFGPVDPKVYGPYPAEGHIVIQKGLACQPCYRNFRMSDCGHQSCLKSLSADEVFNNITRLL
ncbi:MAG: lipopolysaccharide heptosyltransferase II [Candidatus Omnitrophica bacterium]|nr:lipopolysaccharide heptosyltransferase II [Candidatus Omnitrophota bacterium]